MSIQVKCCVVGAGVSGLKTVHTLLNDPKSKFKPEDILVLEALDYIGGRVFTDKTSSKLGYSYDLGASWFHDGLTNVTLKEILEENDKSVFDIDKDGYFDDKGTKYYHPDYPTEVPDELRLSPLFEELMTFIALYYLENGDQKDMSLLEIVDLYIEQHGKKSTKDQLKCLKLLVRWLELGYGISSDKISAKHSLWVHSGRDLFNLKGYSYLVEKMMKQIPKDRVLLNHPVSKINRKNTDNNKPLLVDTPQLKVYCDYLVVTTPLSILKLPTNHPYGITWQPPLPKPAQDALDKIHFGALGKVVFEFDNVWWDKNHDRIMLMSEDMPLNTNLSKPLEKLPEKFEYPGLIINYESLHRHSNVKTNSSGGSFVILIQSPLTGYLESHPDQAWDYFKGAFKPLVMPGKTLTPPINVITSKWTTKPYIRGAYSVAEVGDDPENFIAQMTGDVEGQGLSPVRFAGEHTISEGSGCVHGAYMSGNREAQWIISSYNSLKPSL